MPELSFVKAIVCFVWQMDLSSYLDQELKYVHGSKNWSWQEFKKNIFFWVLLTEAAFIWSKYSKHSNVVKYYFNVKKTVFYLIYIQLQFIPVILQKSF